MDELFANPRRRAQPSAPSVNGGARVGDVLPETRDHQGVATAESVRKRAFERSAQHPGVLGQYAVQAGEKAPECLGALNTSRGFGFGGVPIGAKHRQDPELIAHAQGADRLVRRDHPYDLVEDALTGGLPEACGVVSRLVDRARVDAETKLGCLTRKAQESDRVLGERGGAHHAHSPRGKISKSLEEIKRSLVSTRSDWHRERVDREVAPLEVLADRSPLQRREVDREWEIASVDAPRAKTRRKLVASCAVDLCEAPRRGTRIALKRDIDVGHRATQEQVAQAAADQPPPATERLKPRAHLGDALAQSVHVRTTRDPIPQITS